MLLSTKIYLVFTITQKKLFVTLLAQQGSRYYNKTENIQKTSDPHAETV